MKVDTIVQNYIGSNTYVVHLTENDVIIIDAGASLENVLEIVKGKNVHGIFITHAHFDHILCLQDYLERFGCPLYISKNGLHKLGDSNANLSKMFLGIDLEIVVNNDIVVVHDNDTLEIANKKIKVIETTGHSNCSMSFLVEDILFVGDVVFENGVGRIDFPDSNKEELYQSISHLKQQPYSHVYAGHGKDFNKICI